MPATVICFMRGATPTGVTCPPGASSVSASPSATPSAMPSIEAAEMNEMKPLRREARPARV